MSADSAAAVSRLTTRLPADQALGLRLLALAHAAAAMHLAETTRPPVMGNQAAAVAREAAA